MSQYNMNYFLDEELKEVPEDHEEMTKGYTALLESVEKEEDESKKAILEAKAAIFARILGLLEDSENLFTDAIKILKSLDKTKQATDLRVRMAVTQLYAGKEEEANKIFDQIIEKALIKPKDEGLAKLKELALIAQGQQKFWKKQYPGTIRCLTEASDLKMNRGDTAGFNQLKEAIAKAQAKIDEATGANKTETAPDNYIDPLLALDESGED